MRLSFCKDVLREKDIEFTARPVSEISNEGDSQSQYDDYVDADDDVREDFDDCIDLISSRYVLSVVRLIYIS